MSAQTGTPSLPPPPPSSTRFDRARHGAAQLRSDPNPVWMRELRQSARLTRTPIILAVVTGFVALLMCSVGGLASVGTAPAQVGSVLYHTFFTVAFAVVAWVAPAVAAATIASERGGRTWEALTLTGLGPATIARGKFLASLTYVGLYLVMLSPVGALPFLFGGVSAIEVFLAFVVLILFAVLAVAFGLAVSSKLSTALGAVTVSLLVSVPLSLAVYFGLGVGLAGGIHELWPAVTAWAPVWLPTAYVRGDFGVEYVALLVTAPLALTFVPAWFLYSVTVANMSGVSDDRSSGIKRWFLVCGPAFAVACFLPTLAAPNSEHVAASLGGVTFCLLLVFAIFVFAGEPLGPSRRVQVHWDRSGVGRWRRWLGPGLLQASALLLLVGVPGLLAIAGGGALVELARGGPSADRDALRALMFAGYAAPFFVFVVGLMAWLRARADGATTPRVFLIAALFFANAGPWIVMAISGVLLEDGDAALIFAAPSPLFVVRMIDDIGSYRGRHDGELIAGMTCALGWGVVGLALLAAARARTGRVLAEFADRLAELERALHTEDEARQRAAEAELEPAPDTEDRGAEPAS